MIETRTPESAGERPKKRKRKVLACTACRRRKIQCDRRQPVCSKCEKGGRADSCTYEDDGPQNDDDDDEPTLTETQHARVNNVDRRGPSSVSHETATTSTSSTVTISREIWDDMMSRLRQQERDLALAQAGQSVSSHPVMQHGPINSKQSNDQPAKRQRESLIFRGRGLKTHFYGATDSRSLPNHGLDLYSFGRRLIENSSVTAETKKFMETAMGVKNTLRALRRGMPIAEPITLIPSRSVVDTLVETFISEVDSVYCVLHVPTFRAAYRRHWQYPDSPRPEFVCLLLLIIASAKCLTPSQPWTYAADSSTARDTAIIWIESAEHWLSKQSQKHVGLVHYQIRCLLILAKQINHSKTKRRWVDTGNLLSYLMSTGFHRNADLIPKLTSTFDKEMRRRIWALAVHMDIEASFDRGLPSHVSIAHCDCGMPANLDDDDLDPAMSSLPSPRPATEMTKATFLIYSMRSSQLRQKLSSTLNNPTSVFPAQNVLSYTQEIELELMALPQRKIALVSRHEHAANPHKLVSGMLELQLQELLCMLHSAALEHTRGGDITSLFFMHGFLSAAKAMLLVHHKSMDAGNDTPSLLRDDGMRLALTIAHAANLMCLQEPAKIEQYHDAWLHLLDQSLNVLEAKYNRIGLLQPSGLYAFAAYDYVDCKGDITAAVDHSRHGVGRLARMCRTMWDNQDPAFEAEVARMESGEGALQPRPPTSGANTTNLLDGDDSADPNLLFSNVDIPDFANWTLDDWLFDSVLGGDRQQTLTPVATTPLGAISKTFPPAENPEPAGTRLYYEGMGHVA